MTEILTRKKFSDPVAKAVVETDWKSRGFSCAWFVDPPGQEWNDFVHHCNEVVTVVDGRLEMSVGDATLLVEPGDEVYIPKDTRHSVRNIHSATTRWLYGYD